ncbi:ABC transporter permease [Candidatus Nomurabacteria bacterium]|jgi:putative ABC transport system permease protein|nr:MAG: ABC transporter permease [Candidatus Nomurabacteria bacterium]
MQKSSMSKLAKTRISLKVGAFLAYRDIIHANKWTTGLIIFVMTLTFLNLIVVSGILVGLIQGSEEANKIHYTSDIIISPFSDRSYIDQSSEIINIIKTIPGFVAYTGRYTQGGKIESNYKETLKPNQIISSAGGLVAGIDPVNEDKVTGLGSLVVEGEYLEPGDTDSILIGGDLLFKYTPIDSPGFQTLKNVEVGSKVRLNIAGNSREVIVKGIIKGKVGEVDSRIFMLDTEIRKLIGRSDLNLDEIVIKLADPKMADEFKAALVASGVAENARIQTWQEAQPKFLKDIKLTFALIGNIIGSIGLAVASITIFIVIFVNAITRRRFIGILKGIGISGQAIQFSYVMQSLFYSMAGVGFGVLIVFLLLKPLIAAHPIDFPFSDGILVATISGTLVRAIILFVATIIAGYIPARIVIKQNTLDAILGR